MATGQARVSGRSWTRPPVQLLTPVTPLFVVGILAALLVVGLVSVVLWASVQEGLPGVEASFSLANYERVLSEAVTYTGALNSLLLGAGTVLVNLIFAVPMAWLIHRSNLPFKTFFVTLMYLGIAIPSFLVAIAWILLLSPKIGLVNQLVWIFLPAEEGPFSIYNLPGIAFVQGLALTPLMFFMISASFLAIDPALEEAAEAAGAHRLRVLRRVTVPLVMPAIAAAVIYNFMTAVAIFDIPALLGSPSRINVLSTLMFSSIYSDVTFPRYGVAGVYALMLLVPMLVALYFYQRLLRRSYRYAVVTGKGYRPKLVDLGKWKWAGLAFVSFFFGLQLFLPALVLAWTSLVPYIRLPSAEALAAVNAEGYRQAMGLLLGKPLVNTAILMVSVMAIVLCLSTTISWIVLRTRFPGKYALDAISMLPHAVPGLAFAFAIAFVALSLGRNIPLYGSLFAIVLAHSVSYISFGTRTINGALIQIHHDLEEAVETCGGSKFVAIRRVILPLLAPALFYCGLWVALLSYREVTMALFLKSPQNMVLATTIWGSWGIGRTSPAAALGVIMFVSMVVLVAIALRTASRFLNGVRQT